MRQRQSQPVLAGTGLPPEAREQAEERKTGGWEKLKQSQGKLKVVAVMGKMVQQE